MAGRWLAAVAIAWVAAAALAPAALARPARPVATTSVVCPTSTVGLASGSGEIPAAALDTAYAGASVAYDLRAGSLAVTQAVVNHVCHTLAEARDAYDVAGVPAGTAVPLVAAFDVSLSATNGGCGFPCGGVYYALIQHGATTVMDSVAAPDTHYTPATATLTATLTLPLVIVAGTPETIGFELYDLVYVGSNGGGQGTGQVRFRGVPAGAAIVSCQGFAESVTPVRRGSWGALKTIYR